MFNIIHVRDGEEPWPKLSRQNFMAAVGAGPCPGYGSHRTRSLLKVADSKSLALISASTPRLNDFRHRSASFAGSSSGPLFAFAGIRRLWTGERKGERGEHRLFSFMTTEANDIVQPIHAKATPVLLTTPEEWDTWLGGSIEDATTLQRPLPDHMLKIVATGEKSDAAGVSA
jgi:hypothetical protein